MSISFTDLAVGVSSNRSIKKFSLNFLQDEQQHQHQAHTIDSRRSSVNSSDSSNLCYSSSPSPSTPARPCAVVSNQRVSSRFIFRSLFYFYDLFSNVIVQHFNNKSHHFNVI